MESGEDDICEEYKESLEDLTFNSKPLINVLTMLAEENSQHASSITKLIATRIRQVQQQYKLPSLYLLDSIVKNVGGDYLHLVAQIMEETFTCVFEKADEKTRRDLYKLRHTWSPYFPAKMLHDLDVSVNKHDPGWPISAAPPPSPSIHINPKFLKKAENAGGVASLTAEISTAEEHHVVEGHQQRLLELERLQQEQLKLTELEIQEHQMKRDLLLKKQQQERQLLMQQQQQDILHLRLNTEGPESLLSNGPPSSTVGTVLTKGELAESNPIDPLRDPRLRDRRSEQETTTQPVKERFFVENPELLPVPVDHSHQSERTSSRLEEHSSHLSQADSEMSQFQETRNLQHMAFDKPPIGNMNRVQPVARLEREVTGSPKYGDLHSEPRPKHSHRRRNSGDWSTHASGHENTSEEPKISSGRGKSRKARRRSAERKERERGKSGRGRGQDRNRDPGNDGFQNLEFQNESRFARRGERNDRPVDDWNSDIDRRMDNFVPRNDRPPPRGKWKKDHIVYVRGKDHDEILNSGGPGISEQRLMGIGSERDRIENIKPQLTETEMNEDHFHPREHVRPVFHDEPWDQPTGEPLPKKPRPLLSDVEINELRNRKGASPNTGRMTPPPILHEGFHDLPYDRGGQPFPHNVDGHFHPNFVPPPPEDHHSEWTPAFEIPRELMLDHQNEIMIQADRRLQAGDITIDQHHELVDKLHQLFELQRHAEQMRFPPDMPRPQFEHQPRPMVSHGPGGPMEIDEPPNLGPGRPGPPRFEEHPRIAPRGPAPLDSRVPGVRHDGPRFEDNEPRLRRPHEDFRRPPMDHDSHPVSRPMPLGPEMPPIRSDRMLEGPPRLHVDAPPRLDGVPNPPFIHGRPMEDMPTPRTPPRHTKDEAIPPHTPNTMMEKRAVDDLFRKLMDVGIIKVTPEPGSESPRHVPSPGPPQADVPQLQPPPVKPVSVPSVLPLLNAIMSKKEPSVVNEPIPVIKLVPDELKRRHNGVINSLYEGTQCSSCGLRFPGEAAKIYGEHLDWHFRKNRREKDSRRVAHRTWYLMVNDWLDYEEISDPEERARSSFFDVSTRAVDSPDPLKEAKEGIEGDGSCPVLSGDTPAEAECDICCEEFEQFWEETNEEWHYKSAVRIDGKTYHSLCYQDAKENQSHVEDDNEQEVDGMETDANLSSPVKDEEKTQEKQEQNIVGKSKFTENKEGSEGSTLGEKTVESDVKSSEKDLCKIENTGLDIKGSISVSNNGVDNKENETKGDDK